MTMCDDTSTGSTDILQLETLGARWYHDGMKHIEVAAAVLIEHDSVFAAQRGPGGPHALRWEFPGGKLEAGEDGAHAVVREFEEELHTRLEVVRHLVTVEHQYPTFFLTMHAYLCKRLQGDPTLSEHVAYRWIGKQDLFLLDWAEADGAVAVEVGKLL